MKIGYLEGELDIEGSTTSFCTVLFGFLSVLRALGAHMNSKL